MSCFTDISAEHIHTQHAAAKAVVTVRLAKCAQQNRLFENQRLSWLVSHSHASMSHLGISARLSDMMISNVATKVTASSASMKVFALVFFAFQVHHGLCTFKSSFVHTQIML